MAGGDSDRRENGARDGDEEPFQGWGGCKTDTFGKRVGNGEPVGLRASTDGEKKQRNNGDTDAFGTDSDSRLYRHVMCKFSWIGLIDIDRK
jgi:hypothetical protein